MILNIYVIIVMVLFLDFTSEDYHPDGYEEVYMLLGRGGGADVRDVWLDRGNSSQVQRHHRNLTLREIILEGDYRTDLSVDDLPHEEVDLVFMNALADPLWWMVFNGTAVRSGEWFQQAMRSSSDISGYDVTITDSGSFYPLTIGDGAGYTLAAVCNPTNSNHLYFLFNADQDHLHALPQASVTASYVTCDWYKKFELKYQYEDNSGMQVQECKERCLKYATMQYVIMQMGYKCFCGSLRHGATLGTNTGLHCKSHCPGSDDKCGGVSTVVAVYRIVEKEPRGITTIPCGMNALTYTSHNGELLVSKANVSSDTTSRYFYTNGHRLSRPYPGSSLNASYSMFYNPIDCDNNTRKPYIDLQTGNRMDYQYGEVWNTTLIRAVCIWFVPNPWPSWTSFELELPFELELHICAPTTGHHFFSADYLAVLGKYPLSSTTSTRIHNTYTDPNSYTATESPVTESTTAFVSSGDSAVPGDVTRVIVGSSYSSVLTTESRNGDTTTLTATVHPTVEPQTSDTTTVDTAGGVVGNPTEQTRSTQNAMTSPDVLCTCVCQGHGVNVTDEELKLKIEKIQSILKVDKKTLSSNYWKLNSAHDPRPSSKSIGASGVIILLVFLGAIVLIDLSNLRGLTNH